MKSPLTIILSILVLQAMSVAPVHAQNDSSVQQRRCGIKSEIVVNGGASIPVLSYKNSVNNSATRTGTAFNVGVDVTFNPRNRMFAPVAGARIGVLGFNTASVYMRSHNGELIYYNLLNEKLFNYVCMFGGGIVANIPLMATTKWVTSVRNDFFFTDAIYRGNNVNWGFSTELASGICIDGSTTISARVAHLDDVFQTTEPIEVLMPTNTYRVLCVGVEIKQRIGCMRKKRR